jgi:hypothetical protein
MEEKEEKGFSKADPAWTALSLDSCACDYSSQIFALSVSVTLANSICEKKVAIRQTILTSCHRSSYPTRFIIAGHQNLDAVVSQSSPFGDQEMKKGASSMTLTRHAPDSSDLTRTPFPNRKTFFTGFH